ncbi:hypothetical protein B7494_g5945 [Chlorociboria aeruginascens]|nr:hypothetical protein B7494_g5945 [Chlorociboria aeruginascens]
MLSIVHTALGALQNGGGVKISPKERRKDRDERMRGISSPTDTTINEESPETEAEIMDPNEKLDVESQFYNLKAFYQSQLADTSGGGVLGFSGDYGYGSPAALSRIMGMYTSGSFSDKRSKNKNISMREAADSTEGLHILSPSTDRSLISKLQSSGWEKTTSSTQRSEQFHDAKFLDALRPIPTLLRTKRSKRCRTCRHILSKPESKVQTTRFRIRLVAINYIPSLVIKALSPPSSSSGLLMPYKPIQYLLTFKNPLFDAIKVNVATPAKTPGRFSSKVTILCPQFEVGANTDMWDEALGEGRAGERDRDRKRGSGGEGLKQAEAGKVWERGRNWASIVVEVVPCSLRTDDPEFLKMQGGGKGDGDQGFREDEDIIEIPVFVRVEWEAEGAQDEAGLGGKGEREKRELAYWCVLGVGRIARN